MKKILFVVVISLFVSFINFSCNNDEKKTESTEQTDNAQANYYCPMHPEVTSDKPGTCDKCGGMELVLKGSEETTE